MPPQENWRPYEKALIRVARSYHMRVFEYPEEPGDKYTEPMMTDINLTELAKDLEKELHK